MARACGPVTVYAQKSRIVFQARVRFAGAVVHNEWLEATLWLNSARASSSNRSASAKTLAMGLVMERS